MAWDTEETKRRLKAAAVGEFAERGLAGTTVDRVARMAGVNKERLYHYFGDKENLFAAVLADELARVAEAVPVESVAEGDVGEFAGLVFDYHAAHPQLARLLHWEGLTGIDPLPDEEARAGHYRAKVEAFAAAQRAGLIARDLDPGHLVFMIIALSAWWFAVPQVARMLAGEGSGGSAEEQVAERRRAVVTAARRLARPAD
ncbi:TetR family transcriptional regulator [Kitasatospora sp. NPDC006697]|uniref:TetR family transcriptional regulator n=1 Tax=Kitasatospora sp. NPDC006697 TaxID=3364020 RepID=UPI00369D7466